MSQDISEADWKLLRRLHPIALERFCARALSEAGDLLAAGGDDSHQRFLALRHLLQQREGELSDAFDDLRRSTARFRLASIQSHQLLTDEEFAQFSEATRNSVQAILEIRST